MNAVVQSKPKLPGFVSLLLIIALGILLAKLMWLVMTPVAEISTQASQVSEAGNIQRKKVNYGKLIADQHLFGILEKKVVVKKAPPPPKPVEKVEPKVKLNLKLQGIIAYKSKDGFALISLNNGPQKVYVKGDTIDQGVVVNDILPEKVLLDNNGITEELLLPINDNEKNARDRNRLGSGVSPAPAPSPRSKQTQPPASAKNGAPDLSGFRKEVLANPAKLMDIARPSPAIVDGQFIGFRVQPGRKRQFFRKLGFRPNDIIIEVNGIVLDDASKGAMVLGELSQAAEISVTVKRGNQEIQIQHTF